MTYLADCGDTHFAIELRLWQEKKKPQIRVWGFSFVVMCGKQ
jgi:hypothetical protein